MINSAFTNFNLIGNPYPSALSASAFVAANPQIGGSALYFWDDDGSAGSDYDAAEDYAVWNNLGLVSGPNSGLTFSGNIASCQGFFIDATNTNAIQFNNAMRSTQNNVFFESNTIERMWLSVTTANNHYNETLLALRGDATEGIDNQYDAKKVRGNAHIAFYSKVEGADLAIQAIPSLSTDKVVPLGLEADADGPQTLRLKHIENIDASVQVVLEDTKLGVFQNLRNNPVYNYTYASSTDVNRFRLHLKPAVYLSAISESCVQNDGSILIHSPSATEWNYQVVNEGGQQVATGASFTGTTQVSGLQGGHYIVQLSNIFGSLVQQEVDVPSGSQVAASVSANHTEVNVSEIAIQFTGTASGAVDYTWDFGDGTIVTGILNPSHMYTEPGVYNVTFIASNANCMDLKTVQVRVNGQAAGVDRTEKQALRIYPNPAVNIAMVNLNLPSAEERLNVNVLDATGRVVMSRSYEGLAKQCSLELDVTGLAGGIYQMLIQGDTFSTAAKFTKAD
jgi:hypothetical protein